MLYYNNNTNSNSQQFNNNYNMNIIDISVPAGGYLKNFFLFKIALNQNNSRIKEALNKFWLTIYY